MFSAMRRAFSRVTKDVLKTVLLAGIVKIIFDEKATLITFVATTVSFLLLITIETFILGRRK